MVSEKRSDAEIAFDEWWKEDGRYIDPDFSDVPWFDKREALARDAYIAAWNRRAKEKANDA